MKTFKRKSEDDIKKIKKELRRKTLNPKYFILMFLLGTPMVTILGGFCGSRVSKPWGFSLKILLENICIVFIASFVIYLFNIIYGKPLFNDNFYICKKCLKNHFSYKRKCDCGGTLESSDYYE